MVASMGRRAMTSWQNWPDSTGYRKDGKSKPLTMTQPTRPSAQPTFDVVVAAAVSPIRIRRVEVDVVQEPIDKLRHINPLLQGDRWIGADAFKNGQEA